MLISVSFKSDYASRFVRGSIRNRRAQCHPESRVIKTDDSHTLQLFEEFLQPPQPQGGLRLNLAQRHPITPIFSSQLHQGIKDGVQQRLLHINVHNWLFDVPSVRSTWKR